MLYNSPTMPFSEFTAPRMHAALKASGIGTWMYESATGMITVDDVSSSILAMAEPGNLELSSLLTALNMQDTSRITSFFTGREEVLEVKFRLKDNGKESRRILMKGGREENGTALGTLQYIGNSNFYEPQVSQWDLKGIIAEAPLAVALYVGRELRIGIANDVMLSYWGRTRDAIGTRLEEAVPELEGQPFLQILDNVFTTGEIYQVAEAPAKLALDGKLAVYYFDFTYKPMYDEHGKIYAILNTAINVTDRVVAKRKKDASEKRMHTIVEQSPMAIGFLQGEELLVEIGNEKIFEVWGKDRSVVGLPIEEALPEIKDQGFVELLREVYRTGNTFYGYDHLAKLEHNGELKEYYFDFTYSALRDENNEIDGILILANDVTQRIENIRIIEENEARVRAIIDSSPAAMSVFKGEELILELCNKTFFELIGRTNEVIGMPLEEAMPEIVGQRSTELMRHVLATGEKVHNYGRQVDIVRNGEMTHNYYNVSYTPLFDVDGNVTAVLDVAIDVTENIKARKAMEEVEASLRDAIELAELGTWSLYPESGRVTYSERMLEWFGFNGKSENIEDVLLILHEDDRQRVTDAINRALMPDSKGLYDEEYRVINRVTGRERILHAQGHAFFDEGGKPYLMTGTAQDITAHRKIQTALENQVKERTLELQKANIELEEANKNLLNSNEELAQYAYVASHDLQEPLRKISIFSNLLKEKDTEGVHAAIINKIVRSSDRMSLLIKDLLEFSRLLNTDIRFVKTDLNDIVRNIIHDFELMIAEKGAEVTPEQLAVIEAVPLQMNQLFYNLVGNALKFMPKDRKPYVSINCMLASEAMVTAYVTDAVDSKYYRLTVKDNGIGISEQYQKQIFEVFKRLHARDEYTGSGIGLAICRRIVKNHKGAIYVESVEGAGTSFHILLPEHQ